MGHSREKLLLGTKSILYGLIIFIFAWLFIGERPITRSGDTKLYTEMFNLIQNGYWDSLSQANKASEFFWSYVEQICLDTTDASGWLMTIAFFYIGGICFAAWKWFKRHFTLATFFFLTAFSFWGYGTNGIRNGMATSLVLTGLACVTPNMQKNWMKLAPSIILILLGCLTHNSMYLILATATIAFFFPSRKNAFTIWLVCLIVSPVSSNIAINIFGSFIDDQRLVNYGTQTVSEEIFSRTGWRWDFILYSAMPVLLGWYVVFKKKYYDWTYQFILNIYIYANAFWLLINSVAYSNRFAYLSWFLYPVVLLMPLVRFKLWKSQGLYTGLILIASIIFTIIF